MYAPAMWLLWRTLESAGIDPSALFKTNGVVLELIMDSQARLRLSTLHNLWQRAIVLSGDEALGVKAGKNWHPSQFGALGYACLASSTLRSALTRASKYIRIINDIRIVRLKESPRGFVYTLDSTGDVDTMGIDADVHLAVLIALCRANYGKQLNPLKVTFVHPPPGCDDAYTAHFHCPVEFGAEINSLTLPMDVIDQSLPGDNPALARLNDEMIADYLAHLERSKVSHRVKALVVDQLASGDLHIRKFAELMYMSVRTLQRRLDNEGTSFAHILEETRRELSTKYVRDNNLSMKEISFMLGFSEESAFSRAFKRWEGHAPTVRG